ncbi:MAG: sensor histidine kinase [Acidimicrobiales bacterium]
MPSTSAQIQFVAEFITLLVAAAGMALALLRAGAFRPPRWGPAVLAGGFSAIGAAAFIHGSLLVSGDAGGAVPALRIIGALLVVLVSLRWSVEARTTGLLQAGLAILVIAAVVETLGLPSGSAEVVQAVGSLVVGVALIHASRGSIAARVAASAATTLLAVILVLSVALSAVIASSVQRDELTRLATRARIEGGQLAASAVTAVENARFVAGDLQGFFRTSPDPLVDLGSGALARTRASDAAAIQARLEALTGLYPVGGFIYSDPTTTTVVATTNVPVDGAVTVARLALFRLLACGGAGQSSVVVEGSLVWAIGAYPECLSGGRLLGTVISVTPIGAAYLSSRRQFDPTVSLAIVTPRTVLATSGSQPAAHVLTSAAAAAAKSGQSGTHPVSNYFLSVVPIHASDGSTVASLVLSTPTTDVISTRDQLFRTLFLIALGGTVLALGLAAVTGDRITAGVRRLTQVAARIGKGESFERARIVAPDEVGVLGSTFDSMIDSLEIQTAALQAAADDETRLRNRLEAVVAGMSDGLVAVDAAGRITDFNQAAEELTGLPAVDALGRPADQVLVLVGEDGTPLGGRLRRASPTPWTALATVVPASGPRVPVAVSTGALRGPAGELIGSVLVIRDLRREREVELMKTEFLSRVGHELRTPLTGIMGYTDIMVRHDVDPVRAQMWHEEILAAAKRLLRIVEMLEFFASAGAGRVLLRPEPLEVRGILSGVMMSWSGRLPDGVRLSRRVEDHTPDVLADRRWLALAVDELIDNAVKFSPRGGRILVTARLAPSTVGSGSAVEISIADQGQGMTPEELAGAFAEFAQGDTSDTRRFGGLGLGLALVQRVVAGHGGDVTASSAVDRGSIFTIRLPAVEVSGP